MAVLQKLWWEMEKSPPPQCWSVIYNTKVIQCDNPAAFMSCVEALDM